MKTLYFLISRLAIAGALVSALILSAFSYADSANAKSQNAVKKAKKMDRDAYSRILWTDLMPEDDFAALMNPPDYLSEIQDGSAQDQVGGELDEGLGISTANDPYQQALVSTRVIEAMDGEAVKVPGFVVPVDFDDDQTITKFFLVPYFGACIHEPPPPPNQIIYVDYPKGIRVNALYDAFWVSGVIKTSIVENGIATSAYTMDMHYFDKYGED